MIYHFISPETDGNYNLSLDRFFLSALSPEDTMLYFYVNNKAIIIGRNQNVWQECRVSDAGSDGVDIVRRHTGGGTVFHDSGNLNFSFITGECNYNKDKQFGVILSALASFGINAELSGRNDITVGEKKISGSAFGGSRGILTHHGTLLVSSDLSSLSRYLTVSPQKLKSKGIKSVSSRVCNLAELPGSPESLSVESLIKAILLSYEASYGDSRPYILSDSDKTALSVFTAGQSSWEWIYGENPSSDAVITGRFSFGEVSLNLSLKGGVITGAKVFTDSIDLELPEKISAVLTGLRYDADILCAALSDAGYPELGKAAAGYIRG